MTVMDVPRELASDLKSCTELVSKFPYPDLIPVVKTLEHWSGWLDEQEVNTHADT